MGTYKPDTLPHTLALFLAFFYSLQIRAQKEADLFWFEMRQWCCGRTNKKKIFRFLKARFGVCACTVHSARFGFVWAFYWNSQLKLFIVSSFKMTILGPHYKGIGIERTFLHENKASNSLLRNTHASLEKNLCIKYHFIYITVF